MASKADALRQFNEVDTDFQVNRTPEERESRQFVAQAGDKIWVNRDRLALRPNKELSSETLEVIDIVEK